MDSIQRMHIDAQSKGKEVESNEKIRYPFGDDDKSLMVIEDQSIVPSVTYETKLILLKVESNVDGSIMYMVDFDKNDVMEKLKNMSMAEAYDFGEGWNIESKFITIPDDNFYMLRLLLSK